MADRGPHDLFEQWPDDDADIVQDEVKTWSVITVVFFIALLVAAVVAIAAFAHFLGWMNDKTAADD